LQDAIDQNLGSGFSKIKRTEHISPTAEEVGSLMVKATLTPEGLQIWDRERVPTVELA
jgi:hypothetical protein